MIVNCIDCGVVVNDSVGTFVVCDECYEKFYSKMKVHEDVKEDGLFCKIWKKMKNSNLIKASIPVIVFIVLVYMAQSCAVKEDNVIISHGWRMHCDSLSDKKPYKCYEDCSYRIDTTLR